MLAGCDLFLKYHKRTLEKAFAFDRAMLESLGVRRVRAGESWAGPKTVTGPRLADVLGAAGCHGRALEFLALDGFRFRLSREDVEARAWVVGTRADGRPLGLGDRGPLWLVFDPPGCGRPRQRRSASGPGRCSSSSVNRNGSGAFVRRPGTV